MNSVYKYPLDAVLEQTISLPIGAKILSIGLDPKGDVVMWAIVDLDVESEDRIFHVIGTGWPISGDVGCLDFLGTFLVEDLVFHVFEQLSDSAYLRKAMHEAASPF